MHQDALNASRVLMGDSLGFHIIFVLFGLTLPILVSWFEFMGIRRKDKRLIDIAHFWSKIMALLVIAGVISGTVIALQMSLVWPGILKFGGKVIGLPFMFETYAFIIEAVFLGLYMATWNRKRVSPILHWVFGLFIILGSSLSAFTITSINAWMNLPTGFDIVKGKFENVDVLKAMFSQTSIVEFIHSMPAYYLAAGLTIAGIYALNLSKVSKQERASNKRKIDWFIINKLMVFSAVMVVLVVITADITGKYIAKHEPVKLAAIEAVHTTGPKQPFILGGVYNKDGSISGPYIKIPNALSLLAGNSTNTVVKGLSDYPEDKRPPRYVHTLFDIKLVLVSVMVALVVVYFVAKKWAKSVLNSRTGLLVFGTISFVGLVIVELGWMLTEIGRQPWAVRGYVTTAEAVTKTHDITSFGYIFPLAYVLLFTVTILGIKKFVSDNSKTEAE